ncbi:MAG: cupin domain-containing protein [Opitutales bacterium]
MACETPPIETLRAPEGDEIPNHPRWPALVYRGVLREADDFAAALEGAFAGNGWEGLWRWGVYPFHHFHSTAHEVLGVARGSARLGLGGPQGETVEVEAGDVLLLPAGFGHQCKEARGDFLVVGGYPSGQSADLLRAGEGDLEEARRRIAAVPCPETDPLYGKNGPLFEHWR